MPAETAAHGSATAPREGGTSAPDITGRLNTVAAKVRQLATALRTERERIFQRRLDEIQTIADELGTLLEQARADAVVDSIDLIEELARDITTLTGTLIRQQENALRRTA